MTIAPAAVAGFALRTQDTTVLSGIHGDGTLPDSVVVRSPLPGGVAGAVRWLFNLPTWLQIGGVIVGVLVALAIIVLLWRSRAAIAGWLDALPRTVLVALGATAGAIVIVLVLLARVSWNYTQHNNDFCVGCHVMTTAYTRFRVSEHRKLECHACHQQSIYASLRQVYLWVAEKPRSIPPHAKVPTRVCAQCHIQGPEVARKRWQRIIATAGHSVHLRSRDSSLRGVQCVTCHGVELHHFLPVDKTCGQAGCHASITIKLGKMADQSEMHCVSCHPFTAPVAEHISTDSAARVLVPTSRTCLACHQMRRVMRTFDGGADPHEGRCGWCHDPHKQATPAAAVASCTTSGCHARPDTLTPMHRGLHAGALARCENCHEAHTWKASGAACLRCHQDILEPGRAPRPKSPSPSPEGVRTAAGGARAWTRPAAAWLAAAALLGRRDGAPRDTLPPFAHPVHRSVPCAACHGSTQSHGALKLHSARDCMACHHSPERGASCGDCHGAEQTTSRLTVAATMPVAGRAPSERELPFDHGRHQRIACRDCHTEPVTLAPRACADCHADHHAAARQCVACHSPTLSTHDRDAHLGCGGAGCHADAAVLALGPTRNVCLACHESLANHHPGGECASCHAVRWRTAGAARGAAP